MTYKTYKIYLVAGALALATGTGTAQTRAPGAPPVKPAETPAKPQVDPNHQRRLTEEEKRDAAIKRGEKDGVEVRIKEIARFRGIRPNQLMGIGLVVGLSGTGDTKKSAITSSVVSNLFKDFGINIDSRDIDMKNAAAVMITAELPAYATNGLPIDVSVQSMGDSKSLAGGTLLQAPLYAAGDRETVYAMAQGSLTLGGFDVSSGGNSDKKNFVTAGRIPGGALVQRGDPTKVVYPESKMYIDLDAADLTTAQRVASRIGEAYDFLKPVAINAGTIEITLPQGASDVQTMSQIEQVKVFVDEAGTIVVNERTGTIVMGGNVRVGPAVIAHGSLSVRIDEQLIVSQPEPFSQGRTVVAGQKSVGANESNAQIATIAPTTTVADLARIFQALDLKAADIISILQGLRQQGALKARIITQ